MDRPARLTISASLDISCRPSRSASILPTLLLPVPRYPISTMFMKNGIPARPAAALVHAAVLAGVPDHRGGAGRRRVRRPQPGPRVREVRVPVPADRVRRGGGPDL